MRHQLHKPLGSLSACSARCPLNGVVLLRAQGLTWSRAGGHPLRVAVVCPQRLLGLRQLAQLQAALRQQVPAVRIPRRAWVRPHAGRPQLRSGTLQVSVSLAFTS